MGMSLHELRAALGAQIEAAESAADEIGRERADLFERYMAEPYGDEVEDRSRVVMSDVADTVEWIMPELMELFTAGDRIVAFEPQGPEDEEAAEQETDAVNYVFFRQNDGWHVLYEFLKDGLVQKTGYIKRRWEERETVTTEEYDGLSEEEWQGLLLGWQDEGVEVEVMREDVTREVAQGPDGTVVEGPASISVEVRLTRREGRVVVESVPPEEVLVAPRWNRVTLDGCPFVAHRRRVTVSDLIELGYDRKQVMSLPAAGEDDSEERVERFSTAGSSEPAEREEIDPSMREVLVHECYVRLDWDGDGRAELRRVMVAGPGNEILRLADGRPDNEEVEDQPFSAWTPIPIPHRHYGRSVAELVRDLQRVKTVLTRQLLDNVYLTNNPTREIAEPGIGPATLSDLLTERPGKIVRTAAPGMYREWSPPQFVAQMMPVIEYVDTLRENRSGVTRYNQGLDADALNQTATGIRKIMTASMKKLLLYARTAAELGLRHLFRGIHGDLRRHASKPMLMRLRGRYVSIDPREWRDRADMTVRIGLGTGDRELQAAFLERIIAEIKEHLLAGSPMATLDRLYKAYERYIAIAGFKNAEEFFVNPRDAQAQPQMQAQRPDPAAAVAQIEMAKIQQRQAEAERKAQVELEKARLEDDRERDRMNMEMALKLAEIQAKSNTALTIEQIRQFAAELRSLNQPPPGSLGAAA